VDTPSRERTRDAARSRAAILVAAERLFSERGFDGTSLSDIGAAAGLSRGAPSYFFGSKERLYAQALGISFGTRQEATARAFTPVLAWCEGDDDGLEALRDALRKAAVGYMRYLEANPSFAALIMREELDGARRLRTVSRSSTAIEDAFRAVRRVAPDRGVGSFRVQEAVLLFIALTFAPFSFRRTLMPAVGRDIGSERGRREQARMAADQLIGLIGRGRD
jgi:AcrR family transcriptional regulator